jgi:23S rRNA pseudoU1915 N3-methylase RlmH
MIDPKTKDAAYSSITLLKKRNDRVVYSLMDYIAALENEVNQYNRRLAQPIVAHLEDFEKLQAATEAAAKKALSEASTQALPAISPREGIMEAIAKAEAVEAAKAAANVPWWKFWAATPGGDCGCKGGGSCGGDPAAKK